MLGDHVERSVRRNLELLARYRDPADFLQALAAANRNQQDPLGRSPLLHMELILYAARAEERRPELADRLAARRELVEEIVRTTNGTQGPTDAEAVRWTARMLLALEDGFRLHRLIDPASTPEDSFFQVVAQLQRATGLVRLPPG
jgi:hypothetical protein